MSTVPKPIDVIQDVMGDLKILPSDIGITIAELHETMTASDDGLVLVQKVTLRHDAKQSLTITEGDPTEDSPQPQYMIEASGKSPRMSNREGVIRVVTEWVQSIDTRDIDLENKIADLLTNLRDRHPRDPRDADSSDLAAEIVRQIIPQVRAQALRDFAGVHRPACASGLLEEANRIEAESRIRAIMDNPEANMPNCQTHSRAGKLRDS